MADTTPIGCGVFIDYLSEVLDAGPLDGKPLMAASLQQWDDATKKPCAYQWIPELLRALQLK